MRKPSVLALVLVTLTCLACETPTSPASKPLDVTAANGTLTMKNPNAWPVFYMAVNPEMLALLDFVPCIDPSCPNVPARATIQLPYTRIVAYDVGSANVLVMQWRLRRNLSGDYEQWDGQSVTVPLQ